jgi:hypothetical protein
MHTHRHHWPDWLIAAALFSVALAVYNATLTPSLSYKSPDGNELVTVAYTLGLAHSTGYPLYTWLGKLFTFLPIGDVAHRVNLMSATLGAGAVAVTYAILLHLTRRRLTSACTALLFAFSLTFWSQAGIAEVYAPNMFMVALVTWALLKWAEAEEGAAIACAGSPQGWRPLALRPWAPTLLFWAFALLLGLSLGTHMSNLGFVPAMALFVLLVNWRLIYRHPLLLLVGAGWFTLGVAQFLWLPFKAATLNDPFMVRNAPRMVEGIYRYTLGAFPQFKFAFPLHAIPDRIAIYLWMLARQYGVLGIPLGLYGMAELLVRRPKRFFLLAGMYLVHVWFFVQYRVFDLDVFFIPAHWLFALFLGFGLHRLVGYALALCKLIGWDGLARFARLAAQAGLAALLCVAVVVEVRANWDQNDYSEDTLIVEFYDNVFEVLPQDSVLMGRRGVFGFDMFYWRLVYDVRPDVAIPVLDNSRPDPRALREGAVYSTERAQGGRRNPWTSTDELPSDAWYVPVLVGGTGQVSYGARAKELTLYRVSAEPPQLTVEEADAHPMYSSPAPCSGSTPPFGHTQGASQCSDGARFDGLELFGYDLDDAEACPGGRLHLTLYWRVHSAPRALIATGLGDMPLEAHQLGLIDLRRYIETVRPGRDELVVEDYWIVLPSQIEVGTYPLQIGLQDPLGRHPATQAITLQDVEIKQSPGYRSVEDIS